MQTSLFRLMNTKCTAAQTSSRLSCKKGRQHGVNCSIGIVFAAEMQFVAVVSAQDQIFCAVEKLPGDFAKIKDNQSLNNNLERILLQFFEANASLSSHNFD